MKKYETIPTGYKQVKRGKFKLGDIVQFPEGDAADVEGLAGKRICDGSSKCFRKIKINDKLFNSPLPPLNLIRKANKTK